MNKASNTDALVLGCGVFIRTESCVCTSTNQDFLIYVPVDS